MNKKKMFLNIYLKYFCYAWIFCYILLLIIPAHASYPNNYNVLINILFINIVIITAYFVKKIISGTRMTNLTKKGKLIIKMSKKKLNFIILSSSIISIIGLIMITYDRIIIRGINYSYGLRNARYQWFISEQQGLGGSFLSIVGNLLIPLAYVTIVMTLLHWESLSTKNKNVGFISSLIVIFGHAMLNGGRSNVFLLVIIILCVLIIRKNLKKSIFSKIKFINLKITVIFLIALIFSMQIFASSAKLGGVSSSDDAYLNIANLRGELNENFYYNFSSYDSINQLVLVGSYLIHGQWVAEEAFSLNNHPGEFTFVSIKAFMKQLGIIETSSEPNAYDTGVLISLPGSLYYDYSFIGVIIGAFIIGILFGITLFFMMTYYRRNGMHLGFILAVLMIVFLSPFFPVYNFSYYIFIPIAFIEMEILTRIIYGISNWFEIE